ncbi:hypothetical protein PRIPAC_90245, partial [Pristionchus pacificus]|uniref:Uncharacterized protein n=1 Tax=Pristionchus pacificus TaxID=54126 RepID=A0A2A6CY05_PRIPA
MKLSLLVAAVISGCLCENTVNVRIDGKVTCSDSEFNYRVKLWEEDKSNHDFIAEEKAEGAEEEDYYSIGGRAHDGWFESYTFNIDLKHHTYKRCDACSQAEERTHRQKSDNDG